MITGFNTEIKHRGQVYHVQTEDKGLANPVIESLVYRGGEILATRRHSYRHLVDGGSSEKDLTKLMEEQHKKVIIDIQSGRMEVAKDVASLDSPDDRPLDEMVLDYFQTNDRIEKIKIKLPEDLEILPGVPCEFVISTRRAITLEPVNGARVAINLQAGTKIMPLFSGVCDRFGKVAARFTLPEALGEEAALVITAAAETSQDEVRHVIRRGAAAR